MKASVRWLRELCPSLPDDANAIAARLTAAGLEVEATHAFGLGAEACVVASVVSTRPHPSRSGLRLVTVDHGGSRADAAAGHTQEIVCGAPNVPEPGGLVVLAPLGTYLPAKGMTIERRTIAGVPSEGMLCSEAELGLGDDSDGILVLPAGAVAPGTPLVKALPAARDTILEIGLTPNRPDALGHRGLAREAAALFGVACPFPDEGLDAPAQEDLEQVRVDRHRGRRALPALRRGGPRRGEGRALAARRSLAARVARRPAHLERRRRDEPRDARVRAPDARVRSRARAAGAQSSSGAPASGEKLRTLDGVERALTDDDLVICDGEGPVALAGVMGGGESEITPHTERVLLECAYFDPRGVRRAARRHGLHTESSHRFERGVDWGDTRAALAKACSLVAQMAEGVTRATRLVEARPLAHRTVSLRQDRVDGLLGAPVDPEEAHGILTRLGFQSREGASLARPELPARRVARGRSHRRGGPRARLRRHPDDAARPPTVARRGSTRIARPARARGGRRDRPQRGDHVLVRESRRSRRRWARPRRRSSCAIP